MTAICPCSSRSTTTPAHPSSDFKWKDYCPKVFRSLRAMNGIHDAEYMLSLGGSQALWQLNSPGKSGGLSAMVECSEACVFCSMKGFHWVLCTPCAAQLTGEPGGL